MAKQFAGWLCVANPNWLDFLSRLPDTSQVVYYKGPFRPTTKLPQGAPFICCRNGESPRRIHLIGKFDGFQVLSLADAWRTYRVKLGMETEATWLAKNPGNEGRVSCHLLSEVRFLEKPVPLEATGVLLSNAASNMGRYLEPEEVGRILALAGIAPVPKTPETVPPPPSPLEAPPRHEVTTYPVIRDSAQAKRVKTLHRFECQICGHTIQLPDGSRYAEAHHIRPLGTPHDGPDVPENIMCVCPNHHAELDYGVRPISLSELRVVSGHAISEVYTRHHNELIHRK